MKITPLEIRQKEFEKKLRGYDKDEVNAFLQSLSNEWERVLEENKDLNVKLKQAEKEVAKLREVESSLYKTLKTAEDTGANVIEQANKAAELHMKETKMNAEALLNESKNKSRAMIEQAEMEARQIIEELQDAVKSIQQNHHDIENHRQIAIQELKNLSMTIIEKVERNTQETKEFRFDDYVKRVKKLARDSDERIKAEKTEVRIETKKIETIVVEADVEEEEEPKMTYQSHQAEKVELRKEVIEKPEVSAPQTIINEEKQKSDDSIRPADRVDQNEFQERKQKVVAQESMQPQEEKKGPRISRTVSFFDELDTD